MKWWKNLKGRFRVKEPLKNKVTFKIGGPANFYFEPLDMVDLRRGIIAARKMKLPIFILGAGSNILVADRGIKGMVIRLNSSYFRRVSFSANKVNVSSGLRLGELLNKAKNKNFSGLEFLAGIPGTVGGALAMNAGSWGNSIGDLVEKVSAIDYNGKIKIFRKEKIDFSYRESRLDKYIILGATLNLRKSNKRKIQGNITRFLKLKFNTQDNSRPNAGCIFKNTDKVSAARLIDLAGLKGRQINGACISVKHANFILNKKDCLAKDVLQLIRLIQRSVKSKFRVILEPEIKIWR